MILDHGVFPALAPPHAPWTHRTLPAQRIRRLSGGRQVLLHPVHGDPLRWRIHRILLEQDPSSTQLVRHRPVDHQFFRQRIFFAKISFQATILTKSVMLLKLFSPRWKYCETHRTIQLVEIVRPHLPRSSILYLWLTPSASLPCSAGFLSELTMRANF